MAISKKQATQLAILINACTSWSTAVKDELANRSDDPQRARRMMGFHDKAANELNAILGQVAVYPYFSEEAV